MKSQLKLDCCGNDVRQPHTDLSMSSILPHTHLTIMDAHRHNCQCVSVSDGICISRSKYLYLVNCQLMAIDSMAGFNLELLMAAC